MQKPHVPELVVYTGPMWSGKSRALIGQLELARIAKIPVLLVRPSADTREPRPGTRFSGEVFHVSRASDLFALPYDVYEWIAFDEAQFFEQDFVRTVKRLLRTGKRVLVAGLDLDFKEDPFPVMASILALAHTVHKLKSVCVVCRSFDGTRSQRLTDSRATIQVGGADTYEPRCAVCYIPPATDSSDLT